MRKLSHFLRYGTVLHEKMFLEKAGNTKNALWLNGFSSRADMSPAGQDFMSKAPAGNLSDRVFADYSLFKGKAALSISPILPRFSTTDSGFHKVDKRGCMILKFWPAVGQRKYDYEKRQVFALSPTELGSLISLGPNESCEFFHDPSMQTSNAGQVRKSLSFSPISDGGGYFLNLNVVNNSLKTNERFSVPVSKAEFAVMRTAFSFMLPHIMGWDWYTSQLPTGKVDHYKSSLATKNFEWDK